MGFLIALCYNFVCGAKGHLTPTAAKYIVVNLGGTRDADVGLTALEISEFVRPAETEIIECLRIIVGDGTMLHYCFIKNTTIGFIGAAIDFIVDDTDGSHLATTIDITLYMTAGNVDVAVSAQTSCILQGREEVCFGIGRSSCDDGTVVCSSLLITSVSATIDMAVDGTIGNGDGGIVTYRSILRTAIDIALDGTATDVNGRTLCLSQPRPQRVRSSTELLQTSHRTTKDVTAFRVCMAFCSNQCTFRRIADSTATDINGDITMVISINELSRSGILET